MTIYIVVNQFRDHIYYFGPSFDAAQDYANRYSGTGIYSVRAEGVA